MLDLLFNEEEDVRVLAASVLGVAISDDAIEVARKTPKTTGFPT